ncbi:hypothetical protein M4I21_02585 [Cellulophaga sp. 20_2_10]|uniref:hypothetical protein n=1 Tax=Cellulophaga sp. 20_2_10 TaxID=2942476 RepID=UPI00201B0F48|nr:hypothetical protein [Cellulophaga sp. 20_2_10]MCL5244679.1 hypothetical protein [Cellulophaga sp. 20_2_10]
MIFGITLILLGILAAPSLLLSKKPNAQELLDKITPYQGWIGLGFCVWGVISIVQAIFRIGWLTTYPIYWITYIAVAVVTAALGFILGYGMINKHLLSKNEEAKAKGEALLAKLRPLQGKLGLAAIILGIWAIISSVLFFM